MIMTRRCHAMEAFFRITRPFWGESTRHAVLWCFLYWLARANTVEQTIVAGYLKHQDDHVTSLIKWIQMKVRSHGSSIRWQGGTLTNSLLRGLSYSFANNDNEDKTGWSVNRMSSQCRHFALDMLVWSALVITRSVVIRYCIQNSASEDAMNPA